MKWELIKQAAIGEILSLFIKQWELYNSALERESVKLLSSNSLTSHTPPLQMLLQGCDATFHQQTIYSAM